MFLHNAIEIEVVKDCHYKFPMTVFKKSILLIAEQLVDIVNFSLDEGVFKIY